MRWHQLLACSNTNTNFWIVVKRTSDITVLYLEFVMFLTLAGKMRDAVLCNECPQF